MTHTVYRRRLLHALALLLPLVIAICTAAPARAAVTYYANVTSDGFSIGVTDCATSTNTDCTLREAIAAANANAGADVVRLVANATYTLTINPAGSDDTTTGDINITGDLTVVAASGGVATIDASGMLPTRDRVLTIASGTVSITGVTIRNGSVGSNGGGILNNGTLLLTDCTVSGNAASGGGGGIAHISDGQLTVDHSSIGGVGTSGNTAGTSGGGIAILGNTPVVTIRNGSRIFGNRANGTAPTGNGGGGIYHASNGQVAVTASSIHDNATTSGAGGAILVFGSGGGLTTVTGSTLTDNFANDGGGIRNVNSTTQVTDSVISGNTLTNVNAGFGNGGGVSNDGTVTLTRTTIANNTAPNAAGGVGNGHASATLTDSVVTGNSASFGGGIQNFYADSQLSITGSTVSGNRSTVGNGGGVRTFGTLNATNSTFSGNSAAGVGGGITYQGGVVLNNVTIASNSTGINNSGGTLTLKNALIGNNTGGDCTGGIPSGDFNLASDATCTGFTQPHDRAGVNPLLAPLDDYGGPTQTHALLPGSPAIDGGDDATCGGAAGGVDQRGVARTVSGTHCDIGAFESRGFILTFIGGSGQSAAVGTAFAQALIFRVTSAFEPVSGGVITFSPPTSGPSATITSADQGAGVFSLSATANGTAGTYVVTASAAGAASVSATLTNVPTISAVSPASGATSGGGHITLTGAGFGTTANTQVFVDGAAVPPVGVVSVTAAQIVLVAPPHSVGSATIVVVTNGAASAGRTYTYGAVGPLPTPAPSNPGGNAQPLPNARPPALPAPSGTPAPLPFPRP